ncbi:MAG TPA: hypothetical protein VFO98_03000 [Marmoricola sp.]|nr:hypothetical protein [Marmoricola sp.]
MPQSKFRHAVRRTAVTMTVVAAVVVAGTSPGTSVGTAAAAPAERVPAEAAVTTPAAVTDSSWDDRFGLPGAAWDVRAVVEDGSNLYVGGTFHTVAGQPFDAQPYLARWDGLRWHQLGAGVNGSVTALAVDAQHRLYVAGEFTSAGGAPAAHLAMWDGAWHPLGAGVNGPVAALLADGTDVYVGGSFTSAGGVAVDSLARWSATQGSFSNVGGGVLTCFFCGGAGSPGQVNALAKSGSVLYVAGNFNRVNRNAPADGYASVAGWNGSSWTNLAGGVSTQYGEGTVSALAADGATLYAGGDFTTAGSVSAKHLARWTGTVWSAVGTGAGVGAVGSIGAVHALEVVDGGLYVGGTFDTVDGAAIDNLALWASGRWVPVGDPDATVFALDRRTGGGVHAGGLFAQVGSGKYLYQVGSFDGSAWLTLGQGAVSGALPARGKVRALAAGPDGIYAAGSFLQMGDSVSGGVARWDGSAWHGLAGGISRAGGAHAYALATISGDVYVAGSFSQAGSLSAHNIARWRPGVGWTALGSGTDGTVFALTTLGGKLYAAGSFATAGGVSASGVARFDPATNTWSPLAGGYSFDRNVLALTTYQDRWLVVGGEFNNVSTPTGTQQSFGMRVFDTQTNAWLPAAGTGNGLRMSSGLGGTVRALAVVGDTLYVGGTFDKTGAGTNGAVAARSLVAYDLATGAWEQAGPVVGDSAEVHTLASAGGLLWVGGDFTTAGGVRAAAVARLDTATGAWSGLGSGAIGDGDGDRVLALAPVPGALWVAGDFVYGGGKPAGSIAMVRQPPGVRFTSQPAPFTGSTSATLGFTAVPTGAGVTFSCVLDDGPAVACSSPMTFQGLTAGPHQLVVTATDPTGTGQPAAARWTVVTPPTARFTSGPAAGGWSGRSTSFGFSADSAAVPTTFTCRRDLGAAVACTSPFTVAGLAAGSHSLTVRASNAAGPGPEVTRSWTVDATAPATTMTQPSATRFSLSTALGFAWRPTDTGSGVAATDGRWRRASYASGFGSYQYPATWARVTTPGARLSGAPGSTYCVSARARDKVANLGAWSGERCWAMPLDDRSFARSSGWSIGTGSAFYRGTHTSTTRLGASLTRSGARAGRFALVATRCPTCGQVAIYSGTTLLKRVNLYRATVQRKYVVTWISGYRTGTIKVKVITSGKLVQIDGFGLSRA